MPKIQYITKRFNSSSKTIIAGAIEILDDPENQGYDLTLRSLYYQFVTRNWLENSLKSYKRLVSIISDARDAGLIDWNRLIDRTRNVSKKASWDRPQEIIEACSDQFRFDTWEKQDKRVEVWIEKEALIGVISGVCEKWDVPYFACRGYNSQSEQWRSSQRFQRHRAGGQAVVVLHLGDHDPSGLDMTRDLRDRFRKYRAYVEVERLALNWDQIEEYEPPPNPVKLTDIRSPGYVEEYGDESWELDALRPSVIAGIVETAILYHLDHDRWEKDQERVKRARRDLRKIAENYPRLIRNWAKTRKAIGLE